MFASNASLPGRIAMTIKGKKQKPCINTVSSFFNKYHTCSNCEDFEKNPKKWNFEKVETPKVGDMVIYYRSNDPTYAYHASIIVDIKGGQPCKFGRLLQKRELYRLLAQRILQN